MVNPFYVKPARGVADELQGLTPLIEEIGKRKRAEKAFGVEKERLTALRSKAAEVFATKDPDKIRGFIIKNPEISKTIKEAAEMKLPGASGEAYKNALFSAAVDFSKAPMLLEEMREQYAVDGIDKQEQAKLDQFKILLDTNPEEAKNAVKLDFAAIADADQWDRYKDITNQGPSEGKTPDIKNYEYAKSQGFEGSMLDFQAQGRDTAGSTTAIKEFEYGEKNPKFKLEQVEKKRKEKEKASSGKTFESSTKLRKEFLDQSKEYKKVRDSYTRVAGSTADPSPAGDLSLIFNYMKMLDPGSVVRESEFATAASTGSYGQRIKASVQKVLSGERLAPKMREDFVKKAGVLMKGMQDQHRKREQTYTDIAEQNTLPTDQVVVDINAPGVIEDEQESTKKPQTAEDYLKSIGGK